MKSHRHYQLAYRKTKQRAVKQYKVEEMRVISMLTTTQGKNSVYKKDNHEREID
jgi:hypothetical protein